MRALRGLIIALVLFIAMAGTPAMSKALPSTEARQNYLRWRAHRLSAQVEPRATGGAEASLRAEAVQQISRDTAPPQPGSQRDTQVEPDIAIDPHHPNIVVAVVQQGRFSDGASVAPGYAWSHDSGQTWHHASLPHLTSAVGGRYERASDPVVAFGPDGTVYAQTIGVGECLSDVVVQRSTNGGMTFGNPIVIQHDACNAFNDKNWITVDTSARSLHQGRIYAVWDRVVPVGDRLVAPQVLRYSDDHGTTWSPLILASAPRSDTIGAQPVVQPDGALTNVFLSFSEDGARAFLVARTSRDGGRTFRRPVVLHDAVPYFEPDVRGNGLPSATVDPVTGHLFVVMEDLRYRHDGLNDIVLDVSRDGGRTWARRQRVNRDPTDSGLDHFTPDVAAYGGNVFVTFRTRTHKGGPSNYVEQRYLISRDGGRSFGPVTVIGPAANLSYAALAPVKFLGDYQGTAAGPGVFYAAWCVSTPPPRPARFHQTTWGATVRL